MSADDTRKDSNPKQAFADRKVPVAIGTGAVELWDCLGLLEGALKYGRGNWRVAGVLVSTYLDAARRHLLKFAEGEWCAPDTQVPHLVSVRACVGIILDAWTASMFPVKGRAPVSVAGRYLTDDRTPSVDVAAVEAEATRIANHLREMFKDKTPRHMTIADTYVEPVPLPELATHSNAGIRRRRKVPVNKADLQTAKAMLGQETRRDFNRVERNLMKAGKPLTAKAQWEQRVYR